jgi:hypothetical protein
VSIAIRVELVLPPNPSFVSRTPENHLDRLSTSRHQGWYGSYASPRRVHARRSPEGIVLTQGLSGEPLRFPLHVWYSPTALSRCKPINRAIYHITSGAARKPWCGTVIALKFNGSRRQGYSDAGSNDLPALSAYFLAYK